MKNLGLVAARLQKGIEATGQLCLMANSQMSVCPCSAENASVLNAPVVVNAKTNAVLDTSERLSGDSAQQLRDPKMLNVSTY